MLQSIRDRLSGPTVWFIVALIVVPFAFWGIDSFRGGGGDPVVAEVGTEDITQAQLEAAYRQRYQQLQALLGDKFRADLVDPSRFRLTVLNDLVQESLLQQYARKSGFRADDAALLDYIANIPAFQEDGKFSSERYRTVLAAQGYRPESFEAQIRQALVIEQLRDAVVDTGFATPADAFQAYRLAQQRRTLAVARVPASAFADQVRISDEDIAQRYEAQRSQFMAPERIKLEYVLFDRNALPTAEDPGDDVLRVLYDAQKDTAFTTPEERKARHILLDFGPDKAATRAQAEALVAELRAGADFAELAREHSDDPGSKAAGGDLGWIQRGMMTTAFEEALFALAPGQISEPVETEFGWHIIRLDELRPRTVQAFADVRAQLLQSYREQEAATHFQDKAEQLDQLAFENPTSLAPVAAALDLPVQTTDWFQRSGGAGIAAHAAVLEAAFSPEVIEDNENSRPLALDDDRIVVVRKAEYEPPRQKPLEEVAGTIGENLREEKRAALATAEAQALTAEVAAGKSLAEAAAAHGAEMIYSGSVRRGETPVDAAVVSRAFKLPHPGADAPSLSTVALAGGDVAVIALTAVEEPAMPSLDDPAFQRFLAEQRDRLAGAEFAAYRKFMESQIDVELRTDLVPPAAADGFGP